MTRNENDANQKMHQNQSEPPTGKHNKRKPRYYTKSIKIMYANVNGITSKQSCIDNICQSEKPHIIAFTETKTNMLPPISEYTWKTSRKTNQKGGGVAIASRKDIKNKVRENYCTKHDTKNMEITWITIEANYNTQIHIGNYYGKQENYNIDDTSREFDELTTQIMEKKRTGEVILVGDFNAKLEIKEGRNIIQNESRNGKMLNQLLKITKLTPANIQENNNQWTRVNRHNPK